MNFQTNGGQKVALTLTGCGNSQETTAQSTDSQAAADHAVQNCRKC